MKPTFLVTGGGGFIGTWIVRELLQRQFRVVVFDLAAGGLLWDGLLGDQAKEILFVPGDILDTPLLAKTLDAQNISHVIHLVGLLTPACLKDPVRGAEVNVLGSLRLLELLRAKKERVRGLAYASSYAVHGPSGGTRQNPETFYGVFKRAVEQVAEQYWRHFGMSSVGLRPYVVYGAGREVGISAAPSLAAKAVAAGQHYTFSFSGAAGLVFVEDVARAFVRSALEAPQGAHLVDMPGSEVAMEEVVRLLEQIAPESAGRLQVAGPLLPATREEEPLLLDRLFPDWRETSLEEGLRRTVATWRKML